MDLTVTDLAKLVKYHPETIRRLARAGKIPGAYHIGNGWRFASEAVTALRSGQPYRALGDQEGGAV